MSICTSLLNLWCQHMRERCLELINFLVDVFKCYWKTLSMGKLSIYYKFCLSTLASCVRFWRIFLNFLEFSNTKIQNSIFQKLSGCCITKDHVAFFVVGGDILAREVFPPWSFFMLFEASLVSELEFWLVSVWFPSSKSSWKAKKPSCGWEASFKALERMQARYWSAESFCPFCVPEQTCCRGKELKLMRFFAQETIFSIANLRMPNVENSWISCSNHFDVWPHILPI